WLNRAGLLALVVEKAQACQADTCDAAHALDEVLTRLVEVWETEAGLQTYGDAIANVLEGRLAEGERLAMTVPLWRAFAATASFASAREMARSLGISITWDCELSRTPEGYYQARGGIPWAIAKSLAAAPFADILWMETKTADLKDAKE